MSLSGEEIRRRLVDFAARWSVYEGSERAEAQTFLNELFDCYGTNRFECGAVFEDPQSGRFLDLIWRPRCIIEMKRPSEARKLARHRKQALDYWHGSANAEQGEPAPQYVVICGFRRLEIWEPGRFPSEPRAEIDLVELPDRLDSLLFLAEREPLFLESQEAVTRDAVRTLTDLHIRLRDRFAADADVLVDFLLQSVWCLFAEDLGQLGDHVFTRVLDGLIEDPRRSSSDDLGQLFAYLNEPGARPTSGMYAGTPYVNGGLFKHAAKVHLEQDELRVLRQVAEADWRRVEPHIFGSLLEGTIGPEAQHSLGAHYTHEADIQKVLGPSISRPWRERIAEAGTLKHVQQLQNELLGYVVLDPACGSGNFLYLAYRELRRIERELHAKEAELRKQQGRKLIAEQGAIGAFFPLTNIRGIEIDHFAASLARVTLWMGHKLAVDELDLDEATLPLVDLGGIQVGDALRVTWPKASVIVGNPPFHGDRNLRELLGDDYIKWLKEEFGCGVKDHCVYWFRKAHDHLEPGQRAGLVGTNSVSQNRGRSASLNYIVENGGVITDAVSSQDWPGEAAVDVSIVNWVREPTAAPDGFELDGQEVVGIDTALSESTIPVADVPVLVANKGVAFQGFLPGAQFDISIEQAEQLLARTDASYPEVVCPYLGGQDITTEPAQRPTRYTVDFGQMPLEDAARFPAALDILREQAKAAREGSNSYSRNPHWWQFLWPRPAFRAAAEGRPRFIAGTRVGKRITFVWCEPQWRPSDATNMFALDSDYAMAVLSSEVHIGWAARQSSTLEDRIRYTPSSAFDTFPWPMSSDEQRDAIGTAGSEVLALRSALCAEYDIGLTKLYNQVHDGAHVPLAQAHRKLDTAVLDAYGWPHDLLDDLVGRNKRLYDLNAEIVAGREYAPF